MDDIAITVDGHRLVATRTGTHPRLVFLHPGVGDRRCWFEVMAALRPDQPAIAYDRRGFGETSPAAAPFASGDDLRAVIATCAEGPVVLIGNSQGGRVAIDFALEHPEQVARLVLIAPAVSGAPEPDWDAELGADRVAAIEAAEEAGDLDTVNRYEAAIWLDGPSGPDGRVTGPPRDLFLAMNGVALQHMAAPQPIEPPPAWERLERLAMPVLVLVGSLDLAAQQSRSRAVAERVPDGRLVELDGMAHLPQLEDPGRVAAIIGTFIVSPSR